MVTPTFVYLNPDEVNHYQFMINLDKRSRSCNAANDLSTNLCVPSITADKNVKVFDTITIINEVKS